GAAPMATPRSDHTATLLPNAKVWIAGGRDATGGAALASTELYDPISGSWSAGPRLREARYQHTATALPDGRVLITGGFDGLARVDPAAEIYDPASGTVSPAGQTAVGHAGHAAALLPAGEVLVVGGVEFHSVLNPPPPNCDMVICFVCDAESELYQLTSLAEIYNPAVRAPSARAGETPAPLR